MEFDNEALVLPCNPVRTLLCIGEEKTTHTVLMIGSKLFLPEMAKPNINSMSGEWHFPLQPHQMNIQALHVTVALVVM